jgi:tetratricopeptide (TPR) repeat protein
VLAEVRGSGSSTDPLLSARRLHALAEAAFVCGDFNRSEAAARRAMQLTEGRDEQRYQRATELLVLVRIELGDTRGAVAVAQQLLGRTANARDVRAATTARTALGVALYWSGQPEQAAKHYRDALTGAREAGDVVTQVHVLSDLAGCAFETGHHDECIRLLAEARTLADDIGYRRHLAVNLSNEAQLRAVLGDPYVAACAATAIKRSVDMGDLPAAASTLHTWLSATPALAASVDRWARLTQLDASLDRMLAATTDRAELSVVAARAGRREVALEAAAVADAAAHELEQLQLLPRVRLGRLLAARPTDGAPAESFLAALDELASDPDTEDLERAEIALDRWRTTRTEADRRSAVALATKAFDVEPSAVVRAWFTELGELGPEPPAPLPPPVGIGTSETALADIDDAFTLVEAALATSQRSE